MDIDVNMYTCFILSFVAALGLGSYIGKEIFASGLKYGVKHLFDRRLEEYKIREIKRQKAALIAELFAEWLSYPTDRTKLNKLCIEAFIWLPQDIAKELTDLLAHENCSEVSIRTVISKVRALILGNNESIEPNSIVIYPQKSK